MGKRRAREIWEYDSIAEFQADGGAVQYGAGNVLIDGSLYNSNGASISAIGGGSGVDSKKPILPNVAIKSIADRIYPPNPYPGIGNGAITHPCIVYSDKNFCGYSYWLAYTPYPDNNSDYENPVVCASNDLLNWVSPAANPVVPKPSAGYNADVNLAFSEDGNTLYLIYRERTSGSNYLKLMHTTNGVSWSTPVALKTGTTAAGQDFACPSFWYNPVIKNWECIYHNLDSATNPKPAEKMVSANSDPYSTWGSPSALTIVPTSGQFFWHSHFIRLNTGVIVGLITENTIGGGGSSGITFIAYSTDLINFVVKPINFPLKLYRPSLFIDANGSPKGILSELGIPNFRVCDFFERAEYATYLADIANKLNGTIFALARDTFTRADSASTLGNSEGGTPWTILAGPGGISSNKAYNPGAVNLIAVINTTTPNVEVSFKLDTAAGSGSFIILRAANSTNYIRYGVVNNSTQSIVLQTIESGVVVVNKSYLLVIDYAAKPVFKIRAVGSLLQLHLNDCLFAEETIETFKTNTQHGFRLAGTVGYIDDFLVEGV
jgi:hypothetical protein